MRFIIPGPPIPQHRPRFDRRGHAFDDQKPQKALIRSQIQEQISSIENLAPNLDFETPLSVTLWFYMPIPKTLTKRIKTALKSILKSHISRPDIDNLIKFVLDCSTGLLFSDDAVISHIVAYKIYDKEPRTEILIEYLNEKNFDSTLTF